MFSKRQKVLFVIHKKKSKYKKWQRNVKQFKKYLIMAISDFNGIYNKLCAPELVLKMAPTYLF